MRRTTAVVLGTATGALLLVGAKLGNTSLAAASTDASGGVVVGGPDPGASPVVAIGPSSSTKPAKPGASRSPGASGSAGASRSPGAPAAPGAPSKPGNKPSTTAKPKPTPPKPTTPAGPADGTYSATETVSHNRGTLSMTVTISGHRITNITASETNPTEPNCWNSACPTLKSEALTAQSASIATVSRATYTSEAYQAALAAILAKAKG